MYNPYPLSRAARAAQEADAAFVALDHLAHIPAWPDPDLVGYPIYEAEQAIEAAIEHIKERRSRMRPNTTLQDDIKRELGPKLAEYGFRLSRIPGWRQQQYGFGG